MASKSEGVFTRWLDSSMKSTGRLRFGDERMSFVSDLSIFDWQSFSVESWAEVWMAFFWKIVKEIFYSKGAVVAAYFVDVQYQRIGFETINRKFSSIFNYLQLCKRDENIENGCWEWPILKFS